MLQSLFYEFRNVKEIKVCVFFWEVLDVAEMEAGLSPTPALFSQFFCLLGRT